MATLYHLAQPGGTPHGPYDVETIKGMIMRGEINAETLCFTPGMADWTPLYDVLLAAVPHVPFATRPAGKQRIAYILLGIFFGVIGMHNFYAGYIKKGIIQLMMSVFSCTLLTPFVFIWNLIEICTIEKDADGVPFRN